MPIHAHFHYIVVRRCSRRSSYYSRQVQDVAASFPSLSMGRKQKLIGGRCRKGDDARCESGHCCWNERIHSGRCSVCCTNTDCTNDMPQPPEPGYFGTPFCLKSYTCSAFKDGDASQIPSTGYPIWIPTDDDKDFKKLVIPRTVVDRQGGPVSEQVWYFDLKEQPDTSVLDDIEYNGTHIRIPLYKQMLAGYSRTYTMYDEHETGIVTATYLPNEVSVITDKPKAGMIEKYHTLTYEGEYSTARGEYMRKRNEAELAEEPEFNLGNFAGRMDMLAIIWGITAIISAYVEAGVDKALLWQLRRYAAQDHSNSHMNPDSPSWAHHTRLAKAAITLSKDASFLTNRPHKKSENHCKHFEDGTGVDVGDTHITIPLDRPITTLSGEMVYSPMYYLGLSAGINIVHYDDENKVLQMFYQSFQQSRQYSDVEHQTDQQNPSGLWMSRVSSGEEFDIDPALDGRSDILIDLEKPSFVGDDILKALGTLFKLTPDYSVFARPMADTCDRNYVDSEKWEEMWENIRLTGEGDNAYHSLMLSKDLIGVSNRGVACGGIYMRNDYGNSTHGFGVNEFGVWNHLLLEVSQGHTKEMATADWWDEWECFYTGTDPSVCKAA